MDRLALRLAVHGAEFYPRILSLTEITLLRDIGDRVVGTNPGARIYDSAILNEMLSRNGGAGKIARDLLGPSARPVRAIMFDKSPNMNWALGWHQDRTIAVRGRVETDGFGPWTIKSGCVHVEPPFSVTRQMITLRVHLDDVDDKNAPLLIAPGSHDIGRIAASDIPETVAKLGYLECLAEAGDIWVYVTSILHASDKAMNSRRRRVLQVDFSAMDLPGGLEWSGIDGFDLT